VRVWELVVAGVLLLCASMYLGTGWSLSLFTLPNRATMTAANYYDQIVAPIKRATRFFTVMTVVMIGAAIALVVAEWGSAYVAAPAVVLGAVAAATGLTMLFIFPHNRRLAARITDDAELQQVLGKWIFLNWIRLWFWSAQWVAMATYFAFKAR
jgi:hypothetical protein